MITKRRNPEHQVS